MAAGLVWIHLIFLWGLGAGLSEGEIQFVCEVQPSFPSMSTTLEFFSSLIDQSWSCQKTDEVCQYQAFTCNEEGHIIGFRAALHGTIPVSLPKLYALQSLYGVDF